MHLRAHHLVLAAVVVATAVVAMPGAGTAPPAAIGAFGRGPDVVLVHGLGSSSQAWLPVARSLARTCRVSLVDLPGHGDSAMPWPFSLDAATASLDEALASRSGSSVLVGHSLGGLVCAAEAVAHPERVRALVLVETALRPQVTAGERPALLHALDADYPGLVRAAYTDFGRDTAQGEALAREAASVDRTTMQQWIRLAWSADVSAALARVDVPVLVVLAPRSWGAGERWSDVAAALGYDRVPHLTALRLSGCGHFVMLDRPAELARAIARFAGVPARPSAIAPRRS